MYQELAVSPLFIKELLLQKKTNFKILGLLETEIFLSDSNKIILEEYEKIVKKLNDSFKYELFKEFINTGLTEGRFRIVPNNSASKRSENQMINFKTEIELVKENQDFKIILTDNITEEKLLNYKKLYKIEVTDIKRYPKPNEESKIRAEVEGFIKRSGDTFKLIDWLSKFLIDTEYLEIQDGYIWSKTGREFLALFHLKNLLKRCKKKTNIKIITYSEDVIKNTSDGKKKLEEITKEFDWLKIDIVYEKSKKDISDRHIITDKFEIDIGHAFSGVSKYDKVFKQFNIKSTVK